MTAFVAGATGLTGRAVVAALRQRGVETRAHVRPDSSRLADWQARFGALGAEVDATPWTLAAMTATFRAHPPTLVFGLLGTTRKRMQAEEASYETVDYGLTVLLADAAVAAGARPRFVYLSSQGVKDGQTAGYLGARARVEAHLRQSGLPWTFARPSFILGDRDEARPGERVGASVADGLLAVARVFGGRKLAERYGSNDNETLAQGLVRVGLDPSFEGRIAEGADLR
ncbi:MAG: NAD(P)H-binding protein [Myxococcales bacterium]|nr:NAD(P)H-binding protein [Myxococcales bacterium]MCB9544623.1 NAD(P)H-binding protein [Myxococcales bacterium]